MSGRIEFAPVAWPRTADALGFARAADGVPARDGLALRAAGTWLTLVELAPAPDAPPSSVLGAPGLWRVVQEGERRALVHDLPALRGLVVDAGEPDAGGSDGSARVALADAVTWARATRAGAHVAGWTPPARDEVESWLDPARLGVRSGALLARGELVHDSARLALAFPAIAHVPATLPPARRAWLDGLLLDAQRRWRLVRLGVCPATGVVRAEIDLTGVPAPWARPLVQLSLEALARAVEWVLSPLCFLVDAGAPSQALQRYSFDSLQRSTTT